MNEFEKTFAEGETPPATPLEITQLKSERQASEQAAQDEFSAVWDQEQPE